jgi:endonuclease/exonuclease/phosphatase family metal-dependent hydrolase
LLSEATTKRTFEAAFFIREAAKLVRENAADVLRGDMNAWELLKQACQERERRVFPADESEHQP